MKKYGVRKSVLFLVSFCILGFGINVFGDANNNTINSVEKQLTSDSGNSAKIVGYWQNWYDTRYIRICEVSSKYNIIDVAFALPKSVSDMTIEFNLDTAGTTEAEFKADIITIQAEGRKVLISLGGATSPPVQLNTDADKQKFVSSIIGIIEEYGFAAIIIMECKS